MDGASASLSDVNSQKYSAFIFARGGSKGLPGKNLRSINGKSLLQRAIETCLSTDKIGRVIVSTDSNEIAEAALSFGAEVPFMRPLELASDESPELDGWKHALRTIESLEGKMPETLVSVPTTAPLRQTEDILNCLALFEKVQPDLVVTSAPSPHNPYFNLFQHFESGEVKVPMLKSENSFRRQNVPQVNFITPICYVAKSSYVMNCQNLYEGTVRDFSVDPERAVDIDTLVEFEFAEFLLSKREKRRD